MASSVRFDSHGKHEIVCRSPLQAVCWVYFLRVGNGQESSIIDHFPSEANVEPLVGVEIALYLEIHQTPFLDTLIHVVFSALAINYANQGYMDNWAILTIKNIAMNCLNTQIVEAMPEWEHIFLSENLVETGDDKAMVIGMEFLNTITLASMLSQPHFEASVRMKLALPKVGTWSPPELLRLQSSIAGVKTHCLELFFIFLERS
jgi:hypothetical protein